MVKDINSGSSDSNPTYLTAVGNTLYFRADDGTNGMELWKSDGTATGTVMVKDIRSGSMPGAPNHLTAIGNTLYFAGNDGTNGTELWKSDGTESGTVMIKDIRSGNAGSNLVELTAVGNTLFFNAADGSSSGYELWKSDGTESGTVMVKDINPTSNSSGNSNSQSLTSFCDTLYFSANDGVHDDELWKSDGTTSGTIMVQDIFTGTSSSASSPGNFFNSIIGNHIFFTAQDGIHGEELWALSPSQIICGSSGSSSSTSTPPSIHGTFVSLNDTTSSLSVGHHHACAVVDEKIQCWGEENGGELGDGGSSSSSSSTPVEVDITGLGTPIDVSVSEIGNTSCALFKKNSAYSFRCWGSDEVGAIGDDASYSNETSPSSNVTTLQHGFVEPTAPSSSLDVSNYDIAEVSGGNDFYCARSYQGLVKCWGMNDQGRLGIGNQYYVGDHPNEMGDYQAFTDLGTELYATDITTGDNFACAVLNNTQVKCWGYGYYGQLGSGSSSTSGDAANEMGDNLAYVRSPSSSSIPLSGIVKVDAGYRAACALSSDGQVYCWGYNDDYLVKSLIQSYTYTHTPWHQTQLSRPAIDIAVGYYHACAILDNHQVQCWGRNTEGQLGTGNTTTPNQNVAQKERPYVDLGSDVGASDIMAGGHYTCAILTTEGTVCWGYGSQHRNGRNATGNFITMGEELGNGTGSPYDTIAKSHRSSLSPNSPHTCIVDEMSEVQCWGATHVVPGFGGPSPQTVNVGGLVRSVVVSDDSACALRIDGNLICWGSNDHGQLGHGGTTHNYANSDGEIIIQNTDVRLWSPDTDFDGTINLWDDDDDDDGVLDINDDFSLDECASLDTDNDGMPNTIISSCSTTLVEDLDDDNDGWSDVNETNCDTNSISSLSVPIDTDSDGICNYIDSDDDGDGWSDVQENECEPNSFSTFRAFSTSDSHRYPSTSYSGELYFGGIESSELRYLGSSSSHSYTGMWRWTSNTATSDTLSTSANNLGVMAKDITLEHQDGITYWAGSQYQGSYVDTLTAGPSNGGTNYQNIFYQSSASSYESIISVDASNRMYVADGDDRLYFQTSSQANTSSFNNIYLPNTNAPRHHIAAQDNGTVHHLWWHSNDLKYTQSHVSSNGQSRIYDSTETIGTFTNLNTRSFDLEVDSNGIAHIAYYRNSASSFAVTYMNNSGGSFSSIGFEDFSPNQDGELDLDLDASDRVHLAWNDGTNNTVYHTLIDGSSSVTQQVTSHSNGIYYMSQAIDPKTNKSFILVNSGSTSTISYPGSFISESLDSTLVPGDIDSDGICDNLETAPLIYSNPVFEAGMSASITPTFPGLQPTQIINTTPLPAGLTLDQSTGVISGTPSIPNLAFSVTFNTTSAQENWTGTIEIKITPMAPLLVSADGFDGCGSSVWENQDIVYASDGTMYFVGNWNGASCNAYPTNIPGMENSSSFTNNHLLLSKRSANGTVLWVHAIQNAVTLKAVDLALDANDKPILLFQAAGNYYTEFDRSNNHNIPANSATQTAMILAQFDSDGQVIWKEFTKSIQSQTSHSLTSQNSETSLVVSPDGNITFSGNMLSGSSSYAASFGIGSGNNQINSSRNYCSNYEQPFIVRLDSTGTPLWVRIGNDNPASGSSSCTHHYARDLAVKSDGGVILATQTSGSVGFGSLYTKDNSYTSPAIFSFDSTGQPEWYQLVHASAAQIMGASIAVFDDDSVHVMVTPNVDDSGHGNIVLFYDTGITTSDPSYNSGWNTTKYSHSVHPWISAYDSRAWLLTARLNGNNGTPIWVDMNTEITNPGYSDGYGSRCNAPNRPSPVSYVLNNVAYTYVTDRCSTGTAHLSAYYRSSTIDNEEIHSVSSSTSSSDYEFGVVDFGPDSNDNPFILQRSDYAFYWGRYDSSSGFNHQTISSGNQPILYNIIGETGHQIQDNVPQVGIYTDRRAASQVSPYAEFGQWSLIGINGSNWLPNGLSFNANTGVISGTPTTVTANGTYWLNYTVQGRTISSQITFGVSPTAPTLSYSGTRTLEKGDTMVPWTPSVTGQNYLQSITVTPALPLGLTLDQSNGTISGTPVNNMTSTQFSIVACNSWGVCGAAETITLVINEPLASPVWGGNNTLAFARDVTVRECPVTSGGGMVATWSISSTPSLPFGLAFNTTTGCFEGTPLLYSNAQNYTVTAQNSGGSTAVVVSINITGAGIGLTYPTGSLTLENGTAMQPIAGQTTGDNAQSWAISPSLPAGLYFGSTNGTIWGTPTASNNSASYTITVTSNSGVTASVSIIIEILEPVEEIELTMPTGTVILVNGTPMQPLSGQTVGDAAVSWSISPSLPNGLQISVTNGTIWGTPTETSSLVVYTVTAVTASGESDSDTLSIMIQEDSDGDSIPDVVDTDDDNDGVLDGDEESGCEQNPDCDGDGTNDGDDAFPLDPSEDSDFDNDGIGDNADDDDDNDGWTETNETACGNHSDQDPLDYPTDTDGDGECDFTDTVDDREIAISYPVNVLDLTINQAMMTMSPTVTGGNVTS
ncbi:MAG: ELWxxDGT repeat protein [Candidatus Thermoplasmatota archaeon]|nr:ELWxxDGT repeat protein [Candidatus Thermoplasmatota archaeon]